jgi:hypothetical protein
MATVLKTVIGASLSRVQIPAPPPNSYSESPEFDVSLLGTDRALAGLTANLTAIFVNAVFQGRSL